MKADCTLETVSRVLMRVRILSVNPILARSAGTKLPLLVRYHISGQRELTSQYGPCRQ